MQSRDSVACSPITSTARTQLILAEKCHVWGKPYKDICILEDGPLCRQYILVRRHIKALDTDNVNGDSFTQGDATVI